METIRQLNAFVIDLKALRHAVIFGADLRQRRLTGREVIDKGRAIFTNMRLDAHGKQQLQQGIPVFFRIGNVAQIELRRRFTQLRLIGRQRIKLKMTQERLLIREAFRRLALQHLLKQVIDFVNQPIHVIARTIPLQHREFRIVVTPHLFIAEATTQLEHRATARGQQALHMVFRAGHQIEIHPLRIARADETGLERKHVNIRHRCLTHARRLHLQHAAIAKETANFRHYRRAFQQVWNGRARLPGCRLAHVTFSDFIQGHEVYS